MQCVSEEKRFDGRRGPPDSCMAVRKYHCTEALQAGMGCSQQCVEVSSFLLVCMGKFVPGNVLATTGFARCGMRAPMRK